MRRTVTLMICLCAGLTGPALFAAGAGAARPAAGPPTLASNQAAAQADAAKLLTEVALPAGAQALSAEPAGDNGYLSPETHLEGADGVVDTGWWQVSGDTPAQVIAAAQATPPPGVSSTGSGGGGNTRTGTSSTVVWFFLRDVPGVLDARVVEVTATALSDGATGVMVQAQSAAVVPRTTASMIPAATRMIHLSEATTAGTVLRAATITARGRVRAAVTFFDGLESVQPGVYSCPAEFVEPDLLTVTFLTRRHSAPLATATFHGNFAEPDNGVSSSCDPVELRVGAGRAYALDGGAYVAALDRLFGTHLPS